MEKFNIEQGFFLSEKQLDYIKNCKSKKIDYDKLIDALKNINPKNKLLR